MGYVETVEAMLAPLREEVERLTARVKELEKTPSAGSGGSPATSKSRSGTSGTGSAKKSTGGSGATS